MNKENTEELMEKEEDIQLAENEAVEEIESESSEFDTKRKLLEKTKIVKQTWSILEIFQKIKDKKLILDPNYQRREIWQDDKKTAFIESLYMEIMIPPIYVVEIPGKDVLSENKYEVVDGKQRLTAIMDFINGRLSLVEKALEYYSDIFGGKTFSDIREIAPEKTTQMLSSVLDIYVITANSPEFTKYDIFARLNKGAEKLKVNEIRRAIYHSTVTDIIKSFIDSRLDEQANSKDKEEYKELFTQNDIKRFEDYGRFYRSIAFYMQSNIGTCKVEAYNSRPREMINTVLQKFQKGDLSLEKDKVKCILIRTLSLMKFLKDDSNREYIIDACIPFAIDYWEKLCDKLEIICKDEKVLETFIKSPATTSNVNARFKAITDIMRER